MNNLNNNSCAAGVFALNFKNKIREYREIILNLLKLSLPILGGNLSQILVGFADSITAGRYSTLALGAISVASAILMTITIGAVGLLLSISPVVSNYRGQKMPAKRYFSLILIFSIIVSIPFFLIVQLFLAHINLVGFEPELRDLVYEYVNICSWTIFPVALFVAMKEFLQAYEKVIYPNVLSFLMVFLNVILNFVFTFGYDFGSFSIPSMGLVGIAIATFISKTLIAILLAIYCLPLFKNGIFRARNFIKELLKVGVPISAAIFFEFVGFNLTAVLIGRFSAMFAAVHNVILCIANVTFMIVLSVSNAASIKIGYFNGAGDIRNVEKYSIANIIIVIFICIASFCVLLGFSDEIIKIFSSDPEVIAWCKKILKIALAFLFFDGIQGACVGILKGLKDTKIIMFTMLFSYLLIAIPLGSYLAYYKNIVLEGYWIALAIAIFVVMLITSTKVILNIKKLKKSRLSCDNS